MLGNMSEWVWNNRSSGMWCCLSKPPFGSSGSGLWLNQHTRCACVKICLLSLSNALSHFPFLSEPVLFCTFLWVWLIWIQPAARSHISLDKLSGPQQQLLKVLLLFFNHSLVCPVDNLFWSLSSFVSLSFADLSYFRYCNIISPPPLLTIKLTEHHGFITISVENKQRCYRTQCNNIPVMIFSSFSSHL